MSSSKACWPYTRCASFVKARTAQVNQIRGLQSEFGLIIPQGTGHIAKRVPELIEDGANELLGAFRLLVQRLLDHLKELARQVGELEAQIVQWHRQRTGRAEPPIAQAIIK